MFLKTSGEEEDPNNQEATGLRSRRRSCWSLIRRLVAGWSECKASLAGLHLSGLSFLPLRNPIDCNRTFAKTKFPAHHFIFVLSLPLSDYSTNGISVGHMRFWNPSGQFWCCLLALKGSGFTYIFVSFDPIPTLEILEDIKWCGQSYKVVPMASWGLFGI